MIPSKKSLFVLSFVLALILSACQSATTEPGPTATIEAQAPSLPALDLPPLVYGDNAWLILSVEACSSFQHSAAKTVEGQFIQVMFECTDGMLLLPAMREYSDFAYDAITLTDADNNTYSTFGMRSDGVNVCTRTVVLFNNVPDQPGLLLNFLGQAAVELPDPINTVECTLP